MSKHRDEALIAWKEDHFNSSEGFDEAYGTEDENFVDPTYEEDR